jgi:hypothetical protein
MRINSIQEITNPGTRIARPGEGIKVGRSVVVSQSPKARNPIDIAWVKIRRLQPSKNCDRILEHRKDESNCTHDMPVRTTRRSARPGKENV